MASSLQQVVASILQNNYLSLAIITAVGYDYVLVFPKEMEYIWTKPWTRVSTLFILARYFGLSYAILLSISGTSFFPGPDEMCKVALALFQWSYWIFLSAAEMVMILRVWALYNRSKLVLGTLLAFYIAEVIAFLTCYVFFDFPSTRSEMGTLHVLQFSLCVIIDYPVPKWLVYLPVALQITLGALMCLLTAIQLIKELLRAYRTEKQFKINRYIKSLTKEGVIYFIVILITSLDDLLLNSATPAAQVWFFPLNNILETTLPLAFVPRLILNLRELYARDLLGGRESHIDTGFGLGLGFEPDAIRSGIAFADPMQTESGVRDDEMEIREVDRTSSLV